MLHDFTVHVVVKDKNTNEVKQKIYTLPYYCHEQKRYMMRALKDIEEEFTALQAGKHKEEWDSNTLSSFQRIRQTLLNTANNIERFPHSLHFKNQPIDTMQSGEYVAEVINSITETRK